LDAFAAAYAGVTAVVSGLDGDALLTPSRCLGWSVADTLQHLLFDAQRALVTFATPAQGQPDVDHVTYWLPFTPGSEGSAAGATYIRRLTAALSSPTGVVRFWNETSSAAVRAARTCSADLVATQGHVLTLDDVVRTFVVEAALHHLDLTVGLPDAPDPDAAVLALTAQTLDGLAQAQPAAVAGWDLRTYALKAGGREPLDATDRERLGPLAAAFPLLG
jgi:hypothetical protein